MTLAVCVVVVLLFCFFMSSVIIKIMVGLSVNLTLLFLGRLKPPKGLTGIK